MKEKPNLLTDLVPLDLNHPHIRSKQYRFCLLRKFW